MNQKLKFSFGHIIAFLVLIFFGYISFMGLTYWSDGNFVVAGIGVALIVILLFAVLMIVQQLKGTDYRFRERVVWERVWMAVFVVVCVGTFIPFSHFWTVLGSNSRITGSFSDAIEASKQMFDDYEAYANERIDNYDRLLNRVLSNKELRPEEYRQFGFTGKNDRIEKENKVKALRLQLLSENYDSLKMIAEDWITDASRGASVWNVFLLGNVKEIESSIVDWHDDLVGFSGKKLSTEEYQGYGKVLPFDPGTQSVDASVSELRSLNSVYTEFRTPGILSVAVGIVCFLLLLFPYYIQERNTRSLYTFFGMKGGGMKGSSSGTGLTDDIRPKKSGTDSSNDNGTFTL